MQQLSAALQLQHKRGLSRNKKPTGKSKRVMTQGKAEHTGR